MIATKMLSPVPLTSSDQLLDLQRIAALDRRLMEAYAGKVIVQPALSRQLVSFQANKVRPVYRWYKYKEAFSAALVEYLLDIHGVHEGRLLDPFAGSGTTLFAASELGIAADGIELLPIGQQIIATKQTIEMEFQDADVAVLHRWAQSKPWRTATETVAVAELRITRGAYPPDTHRAIGHYLGALHNERSVVQTVLRFALLCVLESISYTRKDGQYLRWDHRSGRTQGKKIFDKGSILPFDQAMSEKLYEIIGDLSVQTEQPSLFAAPAAQAGSIRLFSGSSLQLMPCLAAGAYDAIVTSPPYCNRYDYTRTYALELALLGADERAVAQLRQDMLSCTVENRAKDLLQINPFWVDAVAAADQLPLLQAILAYLDSQRSSGALNNNGIPRMVRGYFYEMACIIAEAARVLKTDAPLLMVNDNVRYAGASISVDLILSAIAEQLGFYVEQILVLPNGKGNSSQQMGEHGREPLRKCVYVWRKR